MSNVDIESMSFQELRSKCKDLGLGGRGSADILKSRLLDYYNENSDAGDDHDEDEVEKAIAEAEVEDTNDAEEDEPDAEEEEEEEEDAEDGEEEEEDEEQEEEEEEDEQEEDEAFEAEDQEVVGVLVRRKGGEEDGEDEEVTFIPAADFAEAYGADEDDAADDEEDDEFGDLFQDPSKYARQLANILLGLEFLVVFMSLVFKDHPDFKKDSPAGQEFVAILTAQMMTTGFWKALSLYTAVLIVLPTLMGLLLGRWNTADSVFGFSLSRFVFVYVLDHLGLNLLAQLTHFPVTFNVVCGVSVAVAFWDKQI